MTPNPNDPTQIALVARVIRDHEFGCVPGDWDRLLSRAERDGDCYAALVVRRVTHTARAVLSALREAGPT